MSNPLRKYEIWLGSIYGLLQLFLLPMIVVMIGYVLHWEEWFMNCVMFCLNFTALTAIFHRFLIESIRIAIAKPLKTLQAAFLGLMLYFGCSFAVSILIGLIQPDYLNLNDETVSGLVMAGGPLMSVCTAILVPVAEELLFRGILFRGIYQRSPIVAWILSPILFSLIHIVGYIGSYDLVSFLLAFVQYLPAGICLAFAYRKADSILAPILIHMTINLIGLLMVG